jgi:hypothetical protein
VITVSLIGGLGNQMFQYAAAKALADRHRVRLAFDLSGFSDSRYTSRCFLLNHLRVPEETAAYFFRVKWAGRIDRLLGRVGPAKPPQSPQSYSEPHFHYDPAFEALGSHTAVFGYFQSERYFGRIARKLRKWLAPRESLTGAAGDMLVRIKASRLPVSVHVRRGDYLNPGTAEIHGILGESYYREALGRLEGAIRGEPELFVFSDDPAAAEQALNFVPRSRLVHVCGAPERPWEDMALMAHCQHHVIANSSFSWWGAWLNGRPQKTVVAPRAWFAPDELKRRNTNDLYPASWIVL